MAVEMNEQSGGILRLLADVGASLPAVPKKERNSHEGYLYRGIAGVMDTLHGPLTGAGIVIVPEFLAFHYCEKGKTAKGTETLHVIASYAHTFYAPDGSSIRAVTLGEGRDTSDKACNKAHSFSQKYAIQEVLALAYDLAEGDADHVENHAPAAPRPKPTMRQTAPAPAQEQTPFSPEEDFGPGADAFNPAEMQAPPEPPAPAAPPKPSECISEKQRKFMYALLLTDTDDESKKAAFAGLEDGLRQMGISKAEYIPWRKFDNVLRLLPKCNPACASEVERALASRRK